jgi:hypothetical protein
MVIGGVNVQAAILPFVLLGAIIPVLTYLAARQFGCAEGASLFAAAASGALPEFYLNSLRTNTLIPNVVLVAPRWCCSCAGGGSTARAAVRDHDRKAT